VAELRRWCEDDTAQTAQGYADGWRCEDVTGHPPIPDVRDILRSRLQTRDRLCWWSRDGLAWAAVVDLHRVRRHDDATALAELLLWCDQSPRTVMWELTTREAP
jgi:hypothetical protein